MRHFSIFITLLALFLSSCGGGNNNQSNATTNTQSPPPVYDNSLPRGKVTDSVVCKTQNTQNFALYLPSYYTPDKPFPCVFFFDPHARGAMPLRKYKDLAEQYGFVFIGSNTSKNGTQWNVTHEAAKALMDDVRSRINVDPKRIYTAGFSGGSRVANTIAIVDGGVAGVIGCAAGFPMVDNAFQNKFDFFGMVGVYDFNLLEMGQLDAKLQESGFAHQLLTFDGKHEWPPLADFTTAMLWMQACAMKEKLQSKNDSILTALKNDMDKRISDAKADGDAIKTVALLDGTVRALDGLVDVSLYKKQADETSKGKDYIEATNNLPEMQNNEMKEQQMIGNGFTGYDAAWWAKKIKELNENAHNKPKPEAQMNQRVLNFIGLIGYLNSSKALMGGDLVNADKYLKVFKMADPENPDCSYLRAKYYMKNSARQQAIASLDEAATLGYSDVTELMGEPVFGSLHEDAEFKSVVNKVIENRTK